MLIVEDQVLCSCLLPAGSFVNYAGKKFAGFSARFRRLLSLLHESKYVEEMDPQPSTFQKVRLLKNLKKTLHF